MQILGTCEEGSQDAGEDAFTPFFTPQHSANSAFALQNSQDSVDVYHDAFSTLQRVRLNSFGRCERKRHASLGTEPLEMQVEMEPVEDSTETTGMLPKSSAKGRVRHASCSTASYSCSSPYHIGRLSFSTNSLKRKADLSLRRMGSLQRLGGRSNNTLNYLPCVDREPVIEEHASPAPEPVAKQTHPEKPAITPAWMRNYVPSVETERLFGRLNGSTSQPEVQLRPGAIQQPEDTVVQMYTFRPVERRRVGLQRVRDEFKIENLRLQHSAPHLFVSSQWQQHSRMSCLYLGYRIFWALYFSMWAVWAWVGSMGYDADISMKAYFLLYMTNWGVWTLAIDTIIQAINVILHFKKISEDGDAAYPTMTKLMKVSWVLSNITGALHIFITCAYWITVYPNRNDEKLSEIGVNTHIMPGMYTLLDIAVSATPRRLLHAYQPSAFLTLYTLFNLIYFLCGGVDYQGRPALYPVLDWTHPGTTVSIMATVLLGLIPFLHAIICGLYAARVKAWRILRISRYVREEDETDQVEQAAQEQKV